MNDSDDGGSGHHKIFTELTGAPSSQLRCFSNTLHVLLYFPSMALQGLYTDDIKPTVLYILYLISAALYEPITTNFTLFLIGKKICCLGIFSSLKPNQRPRNSWQALVL